MMELMNQTNDLVSKKGEFSPAPIETSNNRPAVNSRKISVDVFTLVQNAKILLKHDEHKLAVRLLREGLHKDSKSPLLLRTLAEGLDSLGRLNEAEKVLSVLCQQEMNFANMVLKANNHYKIGNDDEALQCYFEALALVIDDQPELFEVHKNIGNIFVRRGDFESAEENYNKAYTRAPDSDILLVNYGTLEVQRGDLDKALFCFRKAVEVNSKNDRAWVGLGMVHSQFGDFELAWGNLIKASDINPLNKTALILLAQWSATFQKTTPIAERLIHFVTEFPEDTEMSILLVKLFIDKGDEIRAHLEFTKAYCFHPENEEIQKLATYFKDWKVTA